MNILGRLGFAIVKWIARYGLTGEVSAPDEEGKLEALGVGVQGERYAYWYLRRLGYIFLARNYTTARSKGEIDLVGFDGKTLAFVEVRTANLFLREWHIEECPVRFDVVAIDNVPGVPPVVRLHKDELSPDIRRNSNSRI